MYSKSDLLHSLHHEFRVLKHLYEKVEEQDLLHKFTAKQRTIKELLQYLSHTISFTVKTVIAWWEAPMEYAAYQQMLDTTDVSKFPEYIDQQAHDVTEAIEPLTDTQLQEEVTLRGVITAPRAVHLVNVFAQITAYKMQLFLQLKHTGKHELGTSNLRMGMDTPTQG